MGRHAREIRLDLQVAQLALGALHVLARTPDFLTQTEVHGRLVFGIDLDAGRADLPVARRFRELVEPLERFLE